LDDLAASVGGQLAGVVISVIWGTAGVGKTALALYWAHRVRDRFPDGQLYVNLRGFGPAGGVMSPEEAIRGFLEALGVPAARVPAEMSTQAALYRTSLADKRMLVVLDNARDEDQVRALLPGTPGSLVLVTSRYQLGGLVAAEGAHPWPLDLLTAGEARQLLAGRLGPDRLAAEPAAVEQIVARCARLPAALAIVAARLAANRGLALSSLAARLDDPSELLDTLATGESRTDIRAVFSWSYRALMPPAARLFRLLCVHPGPDISVPAAASLAGMVAEQVHGSLGELVRAHLLDERVPGRYALHDLLHAYAADVSRRVDTEGQRQQAAYRLVAHYVHTAQASSAALDPHRDLIELPPRPARVAVDEPADYEQALTWFATEHPVLLALFSQPSGAELDALLLRLGWNFGNYLDLRGRWHEQVTVQSTTLRAAQRIAHRQGEAFAHRMLACAHSRLGHYSQADRQFRAALRVHRSLADKPGEALTHLGLARVYELQHQARYALRHAQKALALYRRAEHLDGQAIGLTSVGWYHALLGDYETALDQCQRALVMLDELGDRRGAAATWNAIGYARHHMGHHTAALMCYQHALDLYRQLGERPSRAETLAHLGDTHHAIGNTTAAHICWRHALEILEELDHRAAAAVRAKLSQRRYGGPTTPTPSRYPYPGAVRALLPVDEPAPQRRTGTAGVDCGAD
jgi:tetratricopeptide (TPR) repeat protein